MFDTATRIEQHLMKTSDRIAGMVIDTLVVGAQTEKSIEKMISDFITEEVPQHPEPQNLRKIYIEQYDKCQDSEQRYLAAFEESLGLEDHEIVLFNGVMSEMSDEKKKLLLYKIDQCLKFDEFQTIIDNVVKQVIVDIPDPAAVRLEYKNDARSFPSIGDELAKSILLESFLTVAGILKEERPMFDKVLSFFDEEVFHNNLRTIYLG